MAFGLKTFAIQAEVTRRIELPEISRDLAHPVTLVVRAANDANPLWKSQRFRRRAERVARGASGDMAVATPADELELNRTIAAQMASACVVAWENIPPDDGAPAAFSADTVKRFLLELCEDDGLRYIFDRIVGFVINVANFRDAPVVDKVDLGNG